MSEGLCYYSRPALPGVTLSLVKTNIPYRQGYTGYCKGQLVSGLFIEHDAQF